MAEQKWYETTHRWCQTNLTEIDAAGCDIDFWKRYWLENHIQGIIVNAGGRTGSPGTAAALRMKRAGASSPA